MSGRFSRPLHHPGQASGHARAVQPKDAPTGAGAGACRSAASSPGHCWGTVSPDLSGALVVPEECHAVQPICALFQFRSAVPTFGRLTAPERASSSTQAAKQVGSAVQHSNAHL